MRALEQRLVPELVVDQRGGVLVDPAGNQIGFPTGPFLDVRLPFNNRYSPGHPTDDTIVYGRDFWNEIPAGSGITTASLAIFRHFATPEPAPEWQQTPVSWVGRTVYATIAGGTPGFDYELRWRVVDSGGQVWSRSSLLLCGEVG